MAIKEYLPLALAIRQDGTTVMPRSTAAAEDFTWGRERFVAEGRTLASLQNAPGIVRVFDFLEAHGTAYIVMQLLQGETLENRLARAGALQPAEVERILWPLLDGLEQVHNAGFLHRDIKPANILLDAGGNPTLIDFGASRAAMAGRSVALTAIFTPGYAAAEQMTSAKQGPWTDIYGLSATLYHAIASRAPTSAFDRMLDDTCEPLGKMTLPGFPRGLLAGLDAGLAVRASDRPQTIAGWRPILGQTASLDGTATMAMSHPSLASQPDARAPPAAVPPKKRGIGLLVGMVAAVVLVLAGGYYALVDDKRSAPQTAAVSTPSPVEKAAQDAELAAAAQRLKDQEELARLRAESEQRQKAEQEAAQRRQIEEETRRKIEAEMAEKKRAEQVEAAAKKQQEDEARQKADAEAAAKKRQDDESNQKAEAEAATQRKAEEDSRKAGEATENGLRLTTVDRQHVQVALSALGFNTGGTDGAFGARTREMITSWQKARNNPPTGFLTGAQNQALLKEAAPAVARFDDEQKKAEEAKKKADEEKAKAEAAARVAPPQAPAAPAATTPKSGPDGTWRGTINCTASRGGGELHIPLVFNVSGGTGTWVRPGSGPGTGGVQSIGIRINGRDVFVSRVFVPGSQPGTLQTATLRARYDGASTITAAGAEHNGGGRTCQLSLTRQ